MYEHLINKIISTRIWIYLKKKKNLNRNTENLIQFLFVESDQLV